MHQCTTGPQRQSCARQPSLCAYQCTNPACLPVANTHDSFGLSCQRVSLSLCHKPPWLILLSQILHSPEVMYMAWRYIMWLITCLLRVCSALYCKLSASLSRQAVSSGKAGYSCLPDGPSPTPLLLCPLEVYSVRAASWHIQWAQKPLQCLGVVGWLRCSAWQHGNIA